MSIEAKAIVNKAAARVGKDLVLERFQSDGVMVVGVGQKQAVTQINDISGALERIYKHVNQFDVEVKIPMAQNPGFDLAPDPDDPRHSKKFHWADLPVEDRGVEILCDEIGRMQKEYDRLKAEHDAKKAAEEAEDAAPARTKRKSTKKTAKSAAPADDDNASVDEPAVTEAA